MKININGETYEATAHSVTYPNDLLNGVLLDMPENYAFLSEHIMSIEISSRIWTR